MATDGAALAPSPRGTVRAAVALCLGGLYLPSIVLLGATAAFVWHGVALLTSSGQLGRAVLSEQNMLAGPAVIAFVALTVACERAVPAVRRPLLARGHLHDACFFVLFVVAVIPFDAVLGEGIATFVNAHAPFMAFASRPSWPGWLAVGLALVLMDGCNWLTHLADHRLPFLWRVHAVHHTQEEMSVLTTFRAHPLVHTVSTFNATLPVVALTGYHPITPVLITGYLVLGAFPHANLGWSYGPLGRLLCSPAYHRIHHRCEGRQDVNLGIVLSIWDVLSRRAVFPVRGARPCATGLAGRPLEVEQQRPGYRPLHLLAGQLLEPFARRRS
ncbi:MAG TPA: sterol desaturase family protein [Acidimicrobiales bacterium]|nr:sterol desaturase family protein [Acidimicrobiales bacterium]